MESRESKKVINAWAMYDWANSVYSLTITTAVFPAYYEEVTKSNGSDVIDFLGLKFVNTALYSYALSFAFLLSAFLSPMLSGIADYSGRKKDFMKFFAYLGSISCAALYFFTGTQNLLWGLSAFILAGLGYASSLVFYNAFLPEITTPDRFDSVSAKGFSYGYVGSVILLVFNLILIQKPEWFGITDGLLPARISFLSVGVWWAGFSLIPFYYLPSNVYKREAKGNLLTSGFRELNKVWEQVKQLPQLKFYLISFFFYSMGLQTVMYLAALFGKKELGLPTSSLILVILIIQIVAVGGSQLFAYLSKKAGNIKAITISLFIWIGICTGAYFVTTETGFYILAMVVGLVMGGIQSLSRATYSKLLPPTKDHTSFFSFYDVTEKVAIVLGTFTYGAIEEISGSMRNSVLALIIFFVAGMLILLKVKDPKLEAGYKPENYPLPPAETN